MGNETERLGNKSPSDGETIEILDGCLERVLPSLLIFVVVVFLPTSTLFFR